MQVHPLVFVVAERGEAYEASGGFADHDGFHAVAFAAASAGEHLLPLFAVGRNVKLEAVAARSFVEADANPINRDRLVQIQPKCGAATFRRPARLGVRIDGADRAVAGLGGAGRHLDDLGAVGRRHPQHHTEKHRPLHATLLAPNTAPLSPAQAGMGRLVCSVFLQTRLQLRRGAVSGFTGRGSDRFF